MLTIPHCFESAFAQPNDETFSSRSTFAPPNGIHQQGSYDRERAHQGLDNPYWAVVPQRINAARRIPPFHCLARRMPAHQHERRLEIWVADCMSDARSLEGRVYCDPERTTAPSGLLLGNSFSSQVGLVKRRDCSLDRTVLTKTKHAYLTRLATLSTLVYMMFFLPGCIGDTESAYRSGQRISVTKQDDGKRGEATIQKANLFVKLTHQGTIKLNADNDDVEVLENGGQLRLVESQGNTKRIYTVTVDNRGIVNRSFTLNGRETPIDENVQTWFADTLQRTVRESGF